MKHNFTYKILLNFIGLVALLLSSSLQAQDAEILIKGKVVGDNNEAVPGVSILIKGKSQGTVTEMDGSYVLKANVGEVLVFSFIGYESQEITIENQSVINVTLLTDVTQLDEIVVVGYGTQKKSHLTGAISKVSNEQLDQIPMARIDDALVGQVSGVNIQQTNPSAGEAPTIRVRGVGSITSEPNPLIVVDGIAVDNDYLATLDMNDVESIEVLKDAASAAIYGSRGANGVIMITNKSGVEGKAVLAYNGYFGTKSVPQSNVLTSISDWNQYVRDNNNGELTDRMTYINMLNSETNWEEVMMDGGIIQSHSVSARGGNEKTKYSASGSYLKDEGVLLTDSYEKVNFRLSMDSKISDRVTLGLKINPSYAKQRRFPIGVHDAIRQSPWLPLYLDENNIQFVNRLRDGGKFADAQIGDYAQERMFDDFDLVTGMPIETGGTDISTTSNTSPLAKVLERKNYKYRSKLFTNLYLKIKLAKGLSLRSSVGGDYAVTRNKNFTGVKASRNAESGTTSSDDRFETTHLVTEHMLTYNKSFGDHDLNFVGGFAYEFWNVSNSLIDGAGYNFDYIQTISPTNVTAAETFEAQKSLVSFLGRINYAFKNRYLLALSLRTDGSSKFGKNNKYGVFPAVSAGWRMSEENFLNTSEVISNLKLRVSYGVTGSDGADNRIGYYPHVGQIVPVGTVMNGGVYSGFTQSTLSNADLQWEKSVEFNPGVDVGFLEGKINLSLDYYQRNSEDLLLERPVPSSVGVTEAIANIGEVQNSGIEIELSTRNYTNGNFSWSTTGNFSYNKNKLISMAGADGLITTVDPKRPTEWIASEGNPIASFYGYVVDKEIPLNYIDNPLYPINGQSKHVYAKDLNGDGLIDDDDRTILGSPYPKQIWSLTNILKYKNFDLTFMFQGSHGAKVRNIDPQYVNNHFSSKQDYIDDETDPNFFPDADLVVERIFTNDIVMDASYISLRNLNIGYSLPANVASKVGMSRARVYVAAQNLLYIMGSDYRGYNPEGINQGLETPLTYGYQRGAAPIYKTWSVGFNLEF